MADLDHLREVVVAVRASGFRAVTVPDTVLEALLDVAEAARHVDQDLTAATRLALGDALTDLREVAPHG